MCDDQTLLALLKSSMEGGEIKFHYSHQQLVEIAGNLKEYRTRAANQNYKQALIPLSDIDEWLHLLNLHIRHQQNAVAQLNNSHNLAMAYCEALLKREKKLLEIIMNKPHAAHKSNIGS